MTALEDHRARLGAIELAGREIARAVGPASRVRIGNGVRFLVGAASPEGPAGAWSTMVPAGSVLEIRNVPLAQAALLTGAHEGWQIEVRAPADRIHAALLAEQDALLGRLADIEARLEQLDAGAETGIGTEPVPADGAEREDRGQSPVTVLVVGSRVATRLPDRDTPLAQRPVWGDMNSGEVLAIAGENVTVAWVSGGVSTVAATTLTPLAPGEEPVWTAGLDAALQTDDLAEPIPDSALR